MKLRYILRVMRLLVLFLVAGLIHVSAATYSQITLSGKNIPFKEALSAIRNQAGYAITGDKSLLNLAKPVSIDAKNLPLDEFLYQILDNQPLVATIEDKTIVIKRKVETNSRAVKEDLIPAVQQRMITGRVTDEQGNPLEGVTVTVKGTHSIAMTDREGNYKISIQNSGHTLVFTIVGFEASEHGIANRQRIDISMQRSVTDLDEVVAIGYGTVRKSDLTGAVSQVKVGDVGSRAINTFEQLLQGTAAGVQITQSSGAPGSGININIRGVTSLSGTSQPLIVIDGIPYDGGAMSSSGMDSWANAVSSYNPLSTLNPSDIVSMEILKDASATAIFGSRGANGVIIVTTKTGQLGADDVGYTYRTDFSTIPRFLKLLNTEQFIDYTLEAYGNSGLTNPYAEEYLAQIQGINTSWQDLLYRTAVSSDHQLRLGGRSERDNYALTAGYTTQRGTVVGTKFNRISSRFNYERKISSKFTFNSTVNAVFSKNNAAQQSHSNGNPSGSVVLGALYFMPFVSAFDDFGDYNAEEQSNPLLMAELTEDDLAISYFNLNSFLKYQLTDVISLQSRIVGSDSRTRREVYFPRGTYPGDVANGSAHRNETQQQTYIAEQLLSFNKRFNSNHRVDAVFGFTWQEWFNRVIGISATNFPNDNLSYHNFQLAGSVPNPITQNKQWALASWLGRVNYALTDRYILTLTGRYDGATRLSEGNKWAFFPSAALGWNVHNEGFLKNVAFISQLKLRASWGVSGNQNIGVGATQAKLEVNNASREAINNNIYTRFLFNSFATNDLGWESTTQTNLGLDLTLAKNRYRFAFDYYIKNTTDLLLNLTIPSASGYSSYPTNVGKILNRGVEFSFNADVFSGPLTWSLGSNVSFNRNRVVEIGNTAAITGSTYLAAANLGLNQPLHITKPGIPVGSYYGYRTNGIYQNEAEIADGPEDPVNPKPGDFRFVDLSGPEGVSDGRITDADKTIIGNPYPDFVFGISNGFSWRKIDFSVLFQGAIGQDIINLNNYALAGLDRSTHTNVLAEAWVNRWTGEGTSNTWPRSQFGESGAFARRMTDFIVEDGSFVRLKSIAISYDLAGKVIKVNRIKQAKLTLSAINLITWTKYSGYDPEVSGFNSNLTPGVDYGTIPQYRTFSVGVNLGF